MNGIDPQELAIAQSYRDWRDTVCYRDLIDTLAADVEAAERAVEQLSAAASDRAAATLFAFMQARRQTLRTIQDNLVRADQFFITLAEEQENERAIAAERAQRSGWTSNT